MKVRSTVKRKEGIALVITLVMLAVVTVMAIVFLAVTRRERSSVKLAEETAVAKDMADVALERAKAEAIGGMNAAGSKLHYDLFNSQAFYNPAGFDSSKPPTNTNVGPVRDWPAIRQRGDKDYLKLLANLQYDPAAPVFVQTNQNGQGDFRFYLDFNRNRQFETNGVLPDLDLNERPIVSRIANKNVTNQVRYIGDPEWIGVLERPDFPHSETNRFVGRMAYLVLPAGKSLDLNFMHNQVNGPAQLDLANAANGFSRAQGVGSWEINLAAFLRELNTNNYSWFPATYRYNVQPNQRPVGTGAAFDDARKILSFRYARTNYLGSMFKTLAQDNMLNPLPPATFNQLQRFNNNNVEDFGDRPYLASDGEIFFPPNQVPQDRDDPLAPWPGSSNTNAFTDLQQLFNPTITSPAFQGRLQNPARRGTGQTGKSSYDRYSFYRLAAQLGTDSTPALEGKVHLNFKNPVGQITNSVVPWTNAVEFFTLAADQMLKASIDELVQIPVTNVALMRAYGRQPGTYYRIGDTLLRTNFSITNIQVAAFNLVPGILPFATQNEYTPTIHRILQLAANIWDNMNRKRASGSADLPDYPTVFVPEFSKTTDSIILSGFHETQDANQLNKVWRDFPDVLTNAPIGTLTNFNFYGQHFVIGTKKGHPNFNELALQANVEVSRKLAATKASLGSTNIVSTNQMFVVSMNNRWGMETWNSYRTNYRDLRTISGEVISHVVMRDGTNIFNNPPIYDGFVTNLIVLNNTIPQVADWIGATQLVTTNFIVLFDNFTRLLDERSYSTNRGFGTNRFGLPGTPAEFGPLERTPEFVLYTTNKVRFWMINKDNRIVDFVSFDNLSTIMDLRKHLFPPPNSQSGSSLVTGTAQLTENMFWDPTPIGGPGSVLTVGHSNQLAMSSGDFEGPASDALWRSYRYNSPDKRGAISVWRYFLYGPRGIRAQDEMPRNPPAVLTHQAPFTPTKSISWSMSWQVNDPLVHYMHEDLRRFDEQQTLSVNTQMTNWNIGRLNKAYHPWDGSPLKQPGQQADEFAYNVGLQDPGIRRSDDWEFPVARRSTLNGNTNYFFPNIGTLGQVHRGTPWQTVYLKSIYRRNPSAVDPVDGGAKREIFVDPSMWSRWAGTIGSYPARDWRLLDVFTTAANENAARGLLSVNQTNSASWGAVLGGVVIAKSDVTSTALQKVSGFMPADEAFAAAVIEPGSSNLTAIVQSISDARTNQFNIVRNPNVNANPKAPLIAVVKTNRFGLPYPVFDHLGDILGVPALSVQNPYLLRDAQQVQKTWTDQAVEYIPQQIMSLLQRDEPRFVVYAFGQSLKPAPRSLTSDPDYYHMCTNYQIMGEVITKTIFRVEGEPFDPKRPATANNPLRPVVEKYEILPPPE